MARINKDQIKEDLSFHNLFAEASKKDVSDFVDDFFKSIADQVANGDEVNIAGFGKFEAFKRSNGELTPKFRPFKTFKESVSG